MDSYSSARALIRPTHTASSGDDVTREEPNLFNNSGYTLCTSLTQGFTLENLKLTNGSKRKPTEPRWVTLMAKKNPDDRQQAEKQYEESCCLCGGLQSWNALCVLTSSTSSCEQQVWESNMGTKAEVWPSVALETSTRLGSEVGLFAASTWRSILQIMTKTRHKPSLYFNDSVFVVVKFPFSLCVDRCHAVLSLVRYTQALNELIFLPGFGCLGVVFFMPASLM